MTQSVPRSSPVPRLLFLSLLLLFLLVPAQSWALHIAIKLPCVNNWVFHDQISFTLKVERDSNATPPTELMRYLAKLTVSVDGGGEQVLYDSSTPPYGTGLEYYYWTYAADNAWEEHTFAFRGWVWVSTIKPPLMIPQWEKVEIGASPTLAAKIFRRTPSLTVGTEGRDDPDEVLLRVKASAPVGSCAVTVNGQGVSLDGQGCYSGVYPLSAGANTFTVVAEDSETELTTSRSVSVDYHPVSLNLPSQPVDFTQPNSTSLTLTSQYAVDCTVAVVDMVHNQIVKILGTDVSLTPNVPQQFQWDGTSDQGSLWLASNGLAATGSYEVTASLYSSSTGVATGWGSGSLTVTNSNAPVSYAVYEAESTTPSKVGSWSDMPGVELIGWHALATNQAYPTASMTLNFTGSGVDLYYVKAPFLTGAEVYIDGQLQDTLVASDAAPAYKCLWSVSGLSQGPHNIQVRPKANQESETGFIVDAFVVH